MESWHLVGLAPARRKKTNAHQAPVALGSYKFVFPNQFDVYLHDTNVRWMFDKLFRALSHGCVRVKEWRKLSDFLIRNDTSHSSCCDGYRIKAA